MAVNKSSISIEFKSCYYTIFFGDLIYFYEPSMYTLHFLVLKKMIFIEYNSQK